MTVPRESMDEIIGTRQSLRRKAIEDRENIPLALRQEWSARIRAVLQAYTDDKHYSFIHCYLNFRSEVETRELIGGLLRHGTRIIVPVVERMESEEPGSFQERLAHSEIEMATELIKGRFGIEEPKLRSASSLENLDAVIVPIVAFDRHGTRLGYGKGFYDVFLHDLPRAVERIGLAFSIQEIEYIPALSHDERLDRIITEREIIKIVA